MLATPRESWEKIPETLQELTRKQEKMHTQYSKVCKALRNTEKNVERLENERAIQLDKIASGVHGPQQATLTRNTASNNDRMTGNYETNMEVNT